MKKDNSLPTIAILFYVVLVIGATATANAAHHGCSMLNAGHTDIDSNKDGTVSFDEYSAYHSQNLRWSFNALDLDSDGVISESEWDTFIRIHAVGRDYDHKLNS